MVQLAGRAGRGDTPGNVFLQTYTPNHYVLEKLSDPDGFYAHEMKMRSMLRYPPFSRLVLLRFEGTDRRAVQNEACAVARALQQSKHRPQSVGILGPSLAALPKLVGRWRFQVVIRGENVRELRKFCHQSRVDGRYTHGKGFECGGTDPRHLM